MKKTICIFLLILSLVLLVSCGKRDTDDPLLSDYLDRVESFEGVVHQYGKEESRVLFGEKLVATVLYPKTDIKRLDRAIEKYIDGIISGYQLEAASKELQDAAELLVSYDSYLSENSIVSVELTGSYNDSALAHPVDLVAVFNADLVTGKLVKLEELLSEEKKRQAEEKLIKKFDLTQEDIIGNLLEVWSINDGRLKITLPRGEFLPMSEGTKTYLFSERETKKLFEKSKDEAVTDTDLEQEAQAVVSTAPQRDIDEKKPMLAITFDDGPSIHTTRLLDILKKHDARVTFFVLGNNLDAHRNELIRIVSEGHEIGNHSWNHRQFTSIPLSDVKDQIMMTRAKIFDITGVDTVIVRPPYGACDDKVKALGKELGVTFVNWSVDTLDWKKKNADFVYKNIMKDAEDGHIVLCHDLHKTTVDAMEKAIPALVKKGYQLVTVSELLNSRGREMKAGGIYYRQAKGT